MKIAAVFAFTLAASTSVAAQGALSPEELAKEIRSLIESKDIDRIARFVEPGAESESVKQLKASLAGYIGAEGLKVYIVAKDDEEAVRNFLSASTIPGAVKPLDERVKAIAERGWHFGLKPLGDLVVFGKKIGVRSTGSTLSMVYGRHRDSFLITLARRK